MTGAPRSASGPLVVFKGPTSKGVEGKERGEKGGEEKKKRRKGRGNEGKGQDRRDTPKFLPGLTPLLSGLYFYHFFYLAALNLTQLAPGVAVSRSFKVTDLGTDRKPVCDFLLVNNTNLYLISHRF